MKPRIALAAVSRLVFFTMLALMLSCGGEAGRNGSPANPPAAGAGQEIVIVATEPNDNFQKDGPAIRRLTLVKSAEISARDQLSRLLAVLAADLKVKAIVVTPAIRGTAIAFAGLREKRPDLALYAIDSEEEHLEIEEAATFVVSEDQEAGAYSSVWAAARLGCKRFVYVAARAPAVDSRASHRRDVLVKASQEFKLEFAEAYLDPGAKPGKNNAQNPESVPAFTDAPALVSRMSSLGGKTAFYLADESVIPSMIPVVVREGGIVAGMYPVSFLMRHPEAVGAEAGLPGTFADSAEVLAQLEKAIGLQGGSGRLVLPGCPEREAIETAVIFSLQQGLGKKTEKPDSARFAASLRQAAPNISWRVDYSMDRQTGVRSRNHLLVFQDLYLVGRGYLPFTKGSIPESYRR